MLKNGGFMEQLYGGVSTLSTLGTFKIQLRELILHLQP